MTNAKSVLITGATRGLGANLARQFATRGYRLALTGRSMPALEQLGSELQGLSPEVVLATLDVQDSAAISPVIQHCAQQLNGLDIIVANAGVAAVTPAGKGHLDEIRKIIDINLTGAIFTAEAAVELFRQQGHGQLVGISSVAGARGIRGQSAYCASKAGFSRYLEALRLETRREAITITDLAPGFIDTELNRGMASRPFVVSAEKGTEVMADLIERKVGFRYVPPWPWALVARLLKWMPDGLIARM